MTKIGLVTMLAGILLAGSMAWSSLTHADQPSDCAPEDRVVAGNTNTDCKWDFRMDDITGVRFVVLERAGADACYGALEFYPYEFYDLAPGGGLDLSFTKTSRRTGQPGASSFDDYTIDVHNERGNSTLRVIGIILR